MTDVAKEYGVALYSLACEEDREAAFADALETVRDLFAQEPAYLELLASPALPPDERERMIDEAFADRLPQEVVSFLQLLGRQGRIRYFSDCADAYTALYHEANGISVASVTSAVPLTAEELTRLQQRLEAMTDRTVLLNTAVDPSLIGGLTVFVDGKVIDGSVKRRLREMHAAMDETAAR